MQIETNISKIIITGASGFIGTNLLEKFVNSGHSVINIDIADPKNKKHYIYHRNIDITNIYELRKCIVDFDPDYIVHLAARTDLKGKSLVDYAANTVGVKNIIDLSKDLKNLKKIIITSSMLVCGVGFKPNNMLDYHPTTMYGKSKVITENIVMNDKPNCDWAIIRPTSIWGEWFGIPYKNFFDMIIAKRYFHIGNKLCKKTYGYIGNAIYQIENILFSDTSKRENKIFYVGDDPPNDIKEWANEIASFLKQKIVTVPYYIIYIIAIFGDLLGIFGLSFPMTTFRLKNMTTENIIDLSETYAIAPDRPYSRMQGIERTLEWIKFNNKL